MMQNTTHTKKGGWMSALQAFWEGAVSPSLTAATGVVLVVLGQFMILSWCWTADRLADTDPELLFTYKFDYDAYISVMLQRLKRDPHPEFGVVMVTTSSGRHSIQDVDEVSRQLTDLTGIPVRFHLMATGAQSLWDAGAVLDNLPDGFRGIALVSVGPSRFAKSREVLDKLRTNQRLAIESEFLSNEMMLAGLKPPDQTGLFFIDQRKFFLPRFWPLAQNLFLPHKYSHHRYPDGEIVDEKEWSTFTSLLESRGNMLAETMPDNLEVLARLIDRQRERGVQVVLLETTRHPRVYEILGDQYTDYHKSVASFAIEQQVPFWDLDAQAELTENEFRDWSHVSRKNARERYQKVMTVQLAELINSHTRIAGK